MRDPDFTLSAGPVTATPRVLAALGSPIVYHYDPAFIERFRATERKLADVFLTTNDVLLMQGEAVLGLEAGARGLVKPGTKVLNLVHQLAPDAAICFNSTPADTAEAVQRWIYP